VFKSEAERAVSKVEFAPKIVRGKAVERRNVVYPLEFNISE
jgi:protein TonB